MTDNEIIKCLQICSTYGGKCTACPAYVKVDRSKCKQVLVGALDIINRQQAEIERLKECPKCVYEYDGEMTEYCSQSPCPNFKTVEEIKSEAVKEFAERLKEKAYQFPCAIGVEYAVTIRAIDDLLKEMG